MISSAAEESEAEEVLDSISTHDSSECCLDGEGKDWEGAMLELWWYVSSLPLVRLGPRGGR